MSLDDAAGELTVVMLAQSTIDQLQHLWLIVGYQDACQPRLGLRSRSCDRP